VLERGAYTFVLDYNTILKLDLEETALWQFALVFVASDPQNIDTVENKKKAIVFLLQRIQLLQLPYKSLPESENEINSLTDRFIWRLKKSEVELLKVYEERFSKLQF
jgi:hypothetical protein